MKMLRVYPASKTYYAPLFQAYNLKQSKVFFCARWLQHHQHGTPDTSEHAAAQFWQQDEKDVAGSDAVLVYGEPDDVLKGALVEAGMAIAYGVPVILIGEHPAWSTWRWHPEVFHADTIEKAIEMLWEEVDYR